MPGTLVENLQRHGSLVAECLDADGGIRFGVLARIVEQVEQHLFEEHRVDPNHGQIRWQVHIDPMVCQDLPRTGKRCANDVIELMHTEIRFDRAGFKPCHVEQVGDEAVEPLGFVEDRRQQILLCRLFQSVGEFPERSGRAHDRGERGLQVVRYRGEQRRAKAVGFRGQLGIVEILDEIDPLDGERRLIDQRIHQPPPLRRQQRSLPVVVDADDADRRHAPFAGAGTGAWRRATCRLRARPAGRFARPTSRRRYQPGRACPPADSRPSP